MRKLLLLAVAGIAAVYGLALGWPSVAATQQPDFDFFQSPTGNIRCVYENQGGVGCETLNNGRGVVLFSYGGTRLVSGRSLGPSPHRRGFRTGKAGASRASDAPRV